MAQPDGDEATAQALVRHKTVEALRTYYKMLPSNQVRGHGEPLDEDRRGEALQPAHVIPELDASGRCERIDAAISELEEQGAAAAHKG
eukprot:1772110-Prymnesium_polylepis.1